MNASTYKRGFATFAQEHALLEALYAPLKAELAAKSDSVRALAFTVGRDVDLRSWAARGEELLDLRKAGPFQGRGMLEAAAKEIVGKAWSTGSPDEVATAMEAFVDKHKTDLVATKFERTTLSDIARWLYSLEHIRVSYSIRYGDTDIRRLSPGTKGIVLLLLYLAIDRWDTRPLLIDQPEENLDPQSIYDELVKYFKEARSRRQVVLVTHNANLVVNTDADQVIIAAVAKSYADKLPDMVYSSGALEDEAIRDRVCAILEGGKRAFRDRERKYFMEEWRPARLNPAV